MSEKEILDGVEMIDYSEEKPVEQPPKKKMKKWKKVLLTILSVILVLVVVAVGGFFYLRASGKTSIYKKATSEKPNLVQKETTEEESYGELEIDPEQMDAVSNVTSEGSDVAQNGEAQNSEGQNTVESGQIAGSSQGLLGNAQSAGIDIQEGDGITYDVMYKGEKYLYNDDMITMLILGVDKTEKVAPAKDGISGGQSDALFLLTLNPHTNVMDIIAIPRDTIALIDIYDTSGNYLRSGYAQICLQHGYGDGMQLSNERAKNTVSRFLYDLPIHSVTSINMGAVPDLNDAIGGVTLTSLYTFSVSGYSFTEGQSVTLKGDASYHYVHYRDTTRHYTATERLQRQKQYITKFTQTAIQQLKKNMGLVADVYSIVQDYVVTDLAVNDMTYLGSELINYRFGQIYNLEGTVDTSRKYERYYVDQEKLYDLLISQFYEKVE